jgi:hypothetical protein
MARDTTPAAGDTLVYPGGAVKSLDDDGRFEGLLVPFGSADEPDLSDHRDFFTKDTDFWLDDDGTRKCVLLYNHGLDVDLGPIALGAAELKMADAGLWIKGQIKLRDQYIKKYGKHAEAIKAEAKSGKLGLSSGALSHLVRRERQSNGSNKVLSWLVGEGSLTATPADPRAVTHAIKSLAELKGQYLGSTVENEVALAAVERGFELCRRKIGGHLGAGYFYDGPAPGQAPKTRAERLAAIDGCLDELKALTLKAAALIPEDAQGEGAATKSQPDLIDQLLSRLR